MHKLPFGLRTDKRYVAQAMSRIRTIFCMTMLNLTLLGCGGDAPCKAWLAEADIVDEVKVEIDSTLSVPVGAQILMAAYPRMKMQYLDNKIVFPDGTAITYDDGREKNFEETLDNSDIEDMFSLPYDTIGEPGYLADAGRSRSEKLFKKMYGSSESKVKKVMVRVNWFGQDIPMTSVNGAAAQLKKVAEELAQHPDLLEYLNSASTFYWRKVRGANCQSAHSYGIAIDINTSFSDYWLWDNEGICETDRIEYRNRIPLEIVQIFERHGFAWGGRWYHYDTMHFEYRPEIVWSRMNN